jgi:hypothetical protein
MNLHQPRFVASRFGNRPDSKAALWAGCILVGVAILSSLQLSAQPSKTYIGPPYVPGVPDWVYTHWVSPNLRSLFILQYGLLYQAELYQQGIDSRTAAENFKVLVDELGDVVGALASAGDKGSDKTSDIPSSDLGWIQIDAPALTQQLHDLIHQEVFKNNLQDIAKSPDLVPQLSARPIPEIGPPPGARPRLLTHEEVVGLLRSRAFYPLEDPLVSKPVASLDAVIAQYRDLANADKVALKVHEACGLAQVNCYPPCMNLNFDANMACQNNCSHMCDSQAKALADAGNALTSFVQLHICAADTCLKP